MGFEINTVTVSGNLTRDPELRSFPSGSSVCNLRIANNERVKNGTTGEWEDRTNYFDVDVWGGQGDWLASNVSKGVKVVVSGQLKWREWEDKDGNKRQSVSINARDVVPVERNGGGGGGNGSAPASDFQARPESDFQAREPEPVAAPPARATDDDDIPF